LLTVTAVTGPGAITPDKDIKIASNKKADSNNFYSLVSDIVQILRCNDSCHFDIYRVYVSV